MRPSRAERRRAERLRAIRTRRAAPTGAAPDVETAAARRLDHVRRIVCAGLVAGLVLSPRLWVSTRAYPLAPVGAAWPTLPYPLDWIAAGTLVMLLILGAVLPRPRGVLTAAALLLLALALGDQTRWQAWAYHYAALLAVVVAGVWRAGRANAPADALAACRAVTIGLYLWSGIQKLNVTYLTEGFPWLLEPFVERLPAAVGATLGRAGLVVPVIEIAIAVGLATRRGRGVAVWTALATHAFILLTLGPLGHAWNTVVWPWNIAMGALVVALFRGDAVSGARDVLWPLRGPVHALAVLLFCVVPALNLVGRWDAYLSAGLYSHTVGQAGLTVSPAVVPRLPPELRARLDADRTVAIASWAYDELNVPPVPELRVYRQIARAFCRHAPRPTDVLLSVATPRDRLTGARALRHYACDAL